MFKTTIKLLLLTTIFYIQMPLNVFSMNEDDAPNSPPRRVDIIYRAPTNPQQQREENERIRRAMNNIRPLGPSRDINEPVSIKDKMYDYYDEDHHSNPYPQQKPSKEQQQIAKDLEFALREGLTKND